MPTSSTASQQSDENAPKIRRGRVDSLDLYEVTDQELDTIENGSPDSLYLNFSIASLSLATSFLIAILTCEMPSLYHYCFFLICVIIGFAFGILLLCLWWKSRRSIKAILRRIKDRMKDACNESYEPESVAPDSSVNSGAQENTQSNIARPVDLPSTKPPKKARKPGTK